MPWFYRASLWKLFFLTVQVEQISLLIGKQGKSEWLIIVRTLCPCFTMWTCDYKQIFRSFGELGNSWWYSNMYAFLIWKTKNQQWTHSLTVRYLKYNNSLFLSTYCHKYSPKHRDLCYLCIKIVPKRCTVCVWVTAPVLEYKTVNMSLIFKAFSSFGPEPG